MKNVKELVLACTGLVKIASFLYCYNITNSLLTSILLYIIITLFNCCMVCRVCDIDIQSYTNAEDCLNDMNERSVEHFSEILPYSLCIYMSSFLVIELFKGVICHA